MTQVLTRETKQAAGSLRSAGITSHHGKIESLTLTCLSFPPDYSENQPSLKVSHMSQLHSLWVPTDPSLTSIVGKPCHSPGSSCTVAQPWYSPSTCCLRSPPLLSSFLSTLHKNTFGPLSPLTII